MNHNKNASDPIHQQQQQQQQPYHHHPHHANAKCGDLAFGQPYVIVKNELVYQQDDEFMYGNDRWAYLKKRRLSSQLVKCFPLVYVLTHSIAIIVNALIQIGLQIALMTTNGALWFIAAGIWAGVYFLITASFTLLLGKHNFCCCCCAWLTAFWATTAIRFRIFFYRFKSITASIGRSWLPTSCICSAFSWQSAPI